MKQSAIIGVERPTRTNIQLFNRLSETKGLAQMRTAIERAYGLALSLFGYHYLADRDPLVTHLIGTASRLIDAESSSALVAAGMVYPAYLDGCFADGRRMSASSKRRRVVERAVGAEAESIVHEVYVRFSRGSRHLNVASDSPSPATKVIAAAAADMSERTVAADLLKTLWPRSAEDGYLRATNVTGREWSAWPIAVVPPRSIRPTLLRWSRTQRKNGDVVSVPSSVSDRLSPSSATATVDVDHAGALPVAQTPTELFRQLAVGGCKVGELERVRHAYDIAVELFSGRTQRCGRQFLSHVVGCASVVAHLGAPLDLVIAAMLHNVYRNGDFGAVDSRSLTEKRAQMREILGETCERYLHEFLIFTRTLNFDLAGQNGDDVPNTAKGAVLIFLADQLEKLVDHEPLYVPDAAREMDVMSGRMSEYILAAERLNYPALSKLLRAAWQSTTAVYEASVVRPAADGRQNVPKGFTIKRRVLLRHRIHDPVARSFARTARLLKRLTAGRELDHA